MNEKGSVLDVFAELNDEDEVVLETEYGRLYNRVVHEDSYDVDDPLEMDFVFGDYEMCDYLVHTYRGVQVKGMESDGSLEVNGEKVTTIVNVESEEWAGENEELVTKTL